MSAGILIGALLLDGALGEPKWLWSRAPHPAVLMGRVVGLLDKRFNSCRDDVANRVSGCFAVLILIGLGLGLGILFAYAGWIIEILLVAILLAQRSLAEHVAAVATAVRQSLPQGRCAVSMIVSRDTSDMDEASVTRSAIESAAENLSDGVIAPAFWYLVGGLPGLIVYKFINTADSMIGYRTERYEAFGWAAARLDDLLNFIPARLTAALIAAAYGGVHAWREIMQDAGKHRSPNAGWPEAALSRALGVALAGPRSYEGTVHPFEFVNEPGRRHLSARDIDAAVRALWTTWAVFGVLVIVLAVFGF